MNTTLSSQTLRSLPRRSRASRKFVGALEARLAACDTTANDTTAASQDGCVGEPEATLDAHQAEAQKWAGLTGPALRNDRKARAQLCERLLPFFHRVVAKLSFRFGRVTQETIRQESLDMVQYVTCAFLEDMNLPDGVLARWRPAQGTLEAWLRPFVTCRALDCLRKRKRPLAEMGLAELLPQVLEDELWALHSALPNATAQIEHRDVLAKLCERILTEPHLGPETLTLLTRLFWQEEDREEVAASMGLKRNTLDVRVKRMREQLSRICVELGVPFGQP